MKPTEEEYRLAKQIVNEYEKQEDQVDSPVLVGHLNRKIGFNGYKTCKSGKAYFMLSTLGEPVYEFKDIYFIDCEPVEGSKSLPYRATFYKQTLKSSIDFI